MNYDLKNYDEAIVKARKLGKIIILPKENELQLDIDSEEQFTLFHARLKELNALHKIQIVQEVKSSKDGHYHVYIKLTRDIPTEERIILQMFLGSDPIREYLSMCLAKIGDSEPILLFENPDFTLDYC